MEKSRGYKVPNKTVYDDDIVAPDLEENRDAHRELPYVMP